MNNTLLEQYAKRLRLPTVSRNYDRIAKEAEQNKVSYEEFLCCLFEQEIQAREENTRKERLFRARFPAVKTLDQFRFDEIPTSTTYGASPNAYVRLARLIFMYKFKERTCNIGL